MRSCTINPKAKLHEGKFRAYDTKTYKLRPTFPASRPETLQIRFLRFLAVLHVRHKVYNKAQPFACIYYVGSCSPITEAC